MNLTGQTVGSYQLQSVIGRGPRATVYRARQTPGERVVALKVYDESNDPDQIRSVVEATQALTQAHVLSPDEFGVHHGLAWVALRYLPVGSVKSRWRGAVPLNDIARILPQIASALDSAHDQGVLHLNLKPTNILLDRPGNAFVADFGLPTQPDSPYAAPEVGRQGRIDARADVYALGALVYEMLTGRTPAARRPYAADKENLRMAELPPPRSIRKNIPPAVEAVVLRAVSIDPGARYSTPGALARAFSEAVEQAAGEQAAAAPAPRRLPAAGWIALGALGLVAIVAVIIASAGSNNVPAATPPLPTSPATSTTEAPASPAPSPVPTRAATRAPTRISTNTPAGPTGTPVNTSTRPPAGTRSTPGVTPALLPSRAPLTPAPRSPTPAQNFSVVSFALKTIPSQGDGGDRLDLYFDAVISPETGGPYGQLFAYLPTIDSLVKTRIGAQVSSGTQLLHVILVVDCELIPEPVTTDRVFLQIRPTDRGPTLYATSIDYTKTWCR